MSTFPLRSLPGLALPVFLLLALLPADSAQGEEVFLDVAAASGLDVRHVNGMSGKLYFVEMAGPGGAFFDYDNDGDLDVFLPQGHLLGPEAPKDSSRDRLFRNDLKVGADGKRTLRFTEVTAASKIDGRGYGMGVATGDYDNDGDVDLYVTNWGPNHLWRNNGDGTFTEVGKASRTDDDGWGTSAAFFDYDRDGLLDLYVANYVRYSYARHKNCYATDSSLDYCGPLAYEPEADRLYHNRGDGTFDTIVLMDSGKPVQAPGLGVVTADFNGDGWIDVYVANDQYENHLWINRNGKSFTNEALWAGAAVNMAGKAEASMGVDAADFDNDGDEDIFLTHLRSETNTLYRNDGHGIFDDATAATGLGNPSWAFTSFGTAWLDYDGDTWLDLFVGNGEVRLIRALVEAKDPHPLHQTNQLFRNLGASAPKGAGGRPGAVRFEEVTARAGKVFALSEVTRGAAFGDVDNDGDTDVLVLNNGGPVRLLLNQLDRRAAKGATWVGLRLVSPVAGGKGLRDQHGARVELRLEGGSSLWRRVRADASYCSANDPRVLVNLPAGMEPEAVRVYWTDATREEWTPVATGTYTTLRKGSGKSLSSGSAKAEKPGKP